MYAEFAAIEQYLSLSKSTQEADEMLNIDQKVPQNHYLVSEGDVMLSDSELENRFINTILRREEQAPLESLQTPACIPLHSHSDHDQQVQGSESPKSFMDLDNSNSGLSFYDECVQIKQEKIEQSDCYYGQYQQPQMAPKEETFQVIYSHILQEVQHDVERVCHILSISQDPRRWSVEDVRKWITWHAEKSCSGEQIVHQFVMNGQSLCNMSVDEFTFRAPSCGATLYHQLEVWQNAWSQMTMELVGQQTMDYNYLQMDSFHSHLVKPEPPVSPTPSSTSEDSFSVSNSPCYSSQSDDELQNYPQVPDDIFKSGTQHKQTIHLWQFLKELLLREESYGAFIKWVNRKDGIFKIEDSAKVAKLWGRRKNRPAMNYDKLSRSIRQYYKKGIIKKTTHSKRLVYQFCQPYL